MQGSDPSVGRDVAKAVGWGFITFIVLTPVAAYSRHGGAVETVTSILLEPGFRLGQWIGGIIFSDYSKVHSTGSYAVPLIGLSGEFLQLVLLWLIGIRAVRYFRAGQKAIP